MNTPSPAPCLKTADVLAFSPASRQAGFETAGVQRVRGFQAVAAGSACKSDEAGFHRLHGLKVPLIDMRLRVCHAGSEAALQAVIVIARLEGRIMAILLDELGDLLPRGLERTGVLPAKDRLLGVAEAGQHSMVLLDVDKLAPPLPMA